MSANRPTFTKAWTAFAEVQLSVSEVGKKIGGKVKVNIDAGIFANACPIRMSYVLNKTGFPIARNPKYASVSGADGRQYLYRVPDMMRYLNDKFGAPDKTVKSPLPTHFVGMNGIVVIKGHGWSDAVGHVTLWNGSVCSDTCHMLEDPENGTFVPETGSIWKLP